MKYKIQEKLFNFSIVMEIIIAIIILIAIAISSIHFLFDLQTVFNKDSAFFMDFLNLACNVIIGIEFVKMLCRHNVDSVVEVLVFAIARQMIVEHLGTMDLLIGVFAISILFIVRKFLFISTLDSRDKKGLREITYSKIQYFIKNFLKNNTQQELKEENNLEEENNSE